ncbi:MAG: add2, partial [Spartobacteria bacterium]|nr:add2 [Spartobacteria bacterium]
MDSLDPSTEEIRRSGSFQMIDPNLPLIDLHRHIDGSVRLSTILELGAAHGIKLPGASLEELRPHVQVMDRQPGVMAFIAKMLWMTAVLANPDACRRIARESVEDAKGEGIDYIELRFSPWFMAAPHQLDPVAVVAAVVEGVEDGARVTGVRAKVIGILSRTYGTEIARTLLESLLTRRDIIVALDLAGDEA